MPEELRSGVSPTRFDNHRTLIIAICQRQDIFCGENTAGSAGIPAPQVKSVPRAVATGLMLGAWASLPASEVSTASGSDRVDAGSADVSSALSAQRDRGSSPTVREGVIVRVLSVPPAVAGGPLSALADE